MEHLDDTSNDFILREEYDVHVEQVSEVSQVPTESGTTMQERKYTTHIGVGTNKYYCPNPTERTLQVEQYPIGFFISFPVGLSSILKKIQSLHRIDFFGYTYLETHVFESNQYARLYFNSYTQLREFLKSLSKIVSFKDKATNKKLTLPKLYQQAETAYQLAIK